MVNETAFLPDASREARVRRIYDALLTGVPFGIFKMAAGWTMAAHGATLPGLLVQLWGAADIVLNLVSIVVPGHVSYCTLSNLGRRRGPEWEDRLLAVDTFLSFAIVAGMIGFHLLRALPPVLSHAWDAAVIGNVMGVGLDRLYRAFSAEAE